MTVRSVIISFFIISFSFGIATSNSINTLWQQDTGRKLINYEISPFLTATDTGIASTRTGYNATLTNLTTYTKPNNADFNFDFFQSLKYGSILIDLLFNSVFGFPNFLYQLGMPYFMIAPLTIFIVLNHILAVIYIVTGRTFIY